MKDKIWIELPRPQNDAHAAEIIAKANRMLDRLAKPGDQHGRFEWNSRRKFYEYGTEMGFETLLDGGTYFSLDYFGRD
jgi:hypothetical protein